MLATGNMQVNDPSFVRQVIANNDQNLTRQVMAANKVKSSGKGLSPFIVNESFVNFQLPTEDGGKKSVVGLALTAINSTNFDKINFIDAIAKGRFVNVIVIDGKITEINVHQDLMQKIRESNAFEVFIAKATGGYYYPKENATIGIGPLSCEAYYGMVNHHGFGRFIQR